MDIQAQPIACLEIGADSNGQASKSAGDPSSDVSVLYSETGNRLEGKKIQSSTSLSSQDSPLYSQTSTVASRNTSLFSQMSIQSETSIESQVSEQSQGSLQSEFSQYSQSSLSFLQSLGSFGSHEREKTHNYHCVSTLKGHDGHVTSVALVGELLYSGSSSNYIRVWLHGDRTEYCRFGAGDGAVKALVVAGESIISAHQDHKIRVWRTSRQHHKTVHKLLVTMPTLKDYLVSFLPPKNYVRVRRHKKRLWIEHVDTISVLAVSKHNDVLYSGSWDTSVKVWRLSDFKCLESFKAHNDAVNAIALSEDGYVYTGSADSKVKVWMKGMTGVKKKQKHSLITVLESHKSAVNALVLSPDGSMLYSGACDRAIVVWEREDSALHMTAAGALRGHKHAILCMATVDDILCSGSADKTIRVWKRESRTVHSCLAVLHGHRGPVKCINVCVDNTSKRNSMIYSGSLDHDIKIWCVSSSSPEEDDGTDPFESKQIEATNFRKFFS